jgi:DnaK suppressor protein
MLRDRRREVQGEVQRRLSGRRSARLKDVSDELEDSDAHVQGDIDLALLQMKVETVARIDASLARLKAGQYGRCVECERPITERRLRALPFALRCQACEQRREQEHKTGRRLADHGRSVFPDVAGS